MLFQLWLAFFCANCLHGTTATWYYCILGTCMQLVCISVVTLLIHRACSSKMACCGLLLTLSTCNYNYITCKLEHATDNIIAVALRVLHYCNNSVLHIPLFIVAILILAIGIMYTILLFCWQRLLKRIKYHRLCHFFEAYHAPYQFKHCYWTGLLLFAHIGFTEFYKSGNLSQRCYLFFQDDCLTCSFVCHILSSHLWISTKLSFGRRFSWEWMKILLVTLTLNTSHYKMCAQTPTSSIIDGKPPPEGVSCAW